MTKTPFFSDRYDIIVGFTSLSTLPEMVMHELIKIMKNFTVNQQRDIWAVIENSLTSAQDVLPHSTITVVFKANGTVVCRSLGLHNPPSRVMGVDFFCGGFGCRPLPGELRYYNKYHPDIKKEVVRQECSQCKFQSRNVRIGEVDWVQLLPGSRRIFWHDYPPTEQQRALFLDGQCQDAKVKRERVDSMNAVEGARKRRM